jgi:hypothetical protein
MCLKIFSRTYLTYLLKHRLPPVFRNLYGSLLLALILQIPSSCVHTRTEKGVIRRNMTI